MGLNISNPFFTVKYMQLNINFSKKLIKRAVDELYWEKKEISSSAINKKLDEIKKRPQYMQLVYAKLIMEGEDALQPILD